MRILYIITSTTIGGAELKLRDIISGLDRTRYLSVAVICLKPEGPIADDIRGLGVPVVSLNMGYFPVPGDIIRLGKEIKKLKPDIINAFLYRSIQFCRILRLLGIIKTPLLSSTEVNYRTRALALRLLDRCLKRSDTMTICESDTSYSYMLSHMGYDKSALISIRNGIDPFKLLFSTELREKARAELGIAKHECLVISAGRLSKQKGHIYLVETALKLKDKPEIKFAVFGSGSLKQMLHTRIRNNKLEGRFLLAGEKKDMLPWLCAADIFAMPSLWEGIPIALLEAMAIGLPCVVSDVDGMAEVIKNGKNGILCPIASPDTMAREISAIWENVPLRNNISLSAKKTVRDTFNLKNMVGRYEAVYSDNCPAL